MQICLEVETERCFTLSHTTTPLANNQTTNNIKQNMTTEINEVKVNGVKYVRKDTVQVSAINKKGYSIVRCQATGVFMGIVEKSNMAEQTATLKNARRLWYWSGAASLSQLAMDGTSKPKDCKFPCAVTEVQVSGVLEIIPCTEKSFESLNSVSVWKA